MPRRFPIPYSNIQNLKATRSPTTVSIFGTHLFLAWHTECADNTPKHTNIIGSSEDRKMSTNARALLHIMQTTRNTKNQVPDDCIYIWTISIFSTMNRLCIEHPQTQKNYRVISASKFIPTYPGVSQYHTAYTTYRAFVSIFGSCLCLDQTHTPRLAPA